MHLKQVVFLLSLTTCLFSSQLFSQVGDCIGSQYVCQNNYNFPSSAINNGAVPPIAEFPINAQNTSGGNCFAGASATTYWSFVQGQVWFYFKASNNGNICLSIDPINNGEDFDWMVFNMSGMTCADIPTGNAPIVSCNTSGILGTSGPNGLSGAQNNPCIPANQGDEFLLCVNLFTFSGSTQGFDLNVEPSSTASIVDTQDPVFISMASPITCSEDTLEILFTEPVDCGSIDPSAVEIMDVSGNVSVVTDVFSAECVNGTSTFAESFKVVIPAGLPSGNYTFTIIGNVVDVCGNSAQGDVQNFVVNSPVVLNQNIIASTCTANNGSITITPQFGASPYVYSWSNGLPANNTQNNLAPGTYFVTVTDNASCSKVQSITVPHNVPALSASITETNSICTANNGSATINSVSNGTAPYNYTWSGGLGNAASIGPVSPNTYTVTIVDTYGCTLVDQAIIGLTNTTLTTSNNVVSSTCKANDGSITINMNNGTAPYTYQWNILPNPGNVSVVNALDSGTYRITITDVNGCQTTQNIFLQANNVNLSVNAVTVDPICLTPNGSITLTPGGGLAPYSYNWSDPLLSGSNPTNLANGSYLVTVTDANGCEEINNYTLTRDFSNLPVLSLLNKNNTSCSNTSDGDAEVVCNNGGYGGYTYLWLDGTVGAIHTNMGAGQYKAVVTDIYGCPDTLSVFITSPSPITMNPLTDTSICLGGTVTFTASANGGTPPMNYAWFSGVISGGATITDNPVVATTYKVTAFDGNGCLAIDTAMANVSFYPGITTTVPSVAGVCQGENATVTVQASGGNGLFTYQWSNGSVSQSTVVAPYYTSLYYVTVSNAGSCANTPVVDSVKVYVATTPTVQFSSDKASGCVPVEVNFFISNYNSNYTYQWTYGDGNSEIFNGIKATHNYEKTGCKNVTLTVVSDSGCTSHLTNTCMIDVYPLPKVDFSYSPGNPTNLAPEVTFHDLTDGAIQWQWDIANTDFFNVPEFRYKFSDAGDYVVTLIAVNTNGCRDTTEKTVTVEHETVLFIPDAFTPNGDQLNDEFGPIGEGVSANGFEFVVINRWGEVVYETETFGQLWNGRKQNTGDGVCEDGVYSYSVNYRNHKGTKRSMKGHVVLLKLNRD